MKYDVGARNLGGGKIESYVDYVGPDYNHGSINDVRKTITRQVIDTQEEQTKLALMALGWTPPIPAPLIGKKCIVKGCTNYQGQGYFVGDLCAPCHRMLTTGNAAHNNTFVGELHQKARQLASLKSQVQELIKE